MSLTHIETIELGSSQSSITFSSIPQDYDDLKLVISSRNDIGTGSNTYAAIYFNGDTTSGNYANLTLVGNGTSVQSEVRSPSSTMLITPNATMTANSFGNADIYVSNYTASVNKSVSSDSVTERNGNPANQLLLANLWSDTSAITSLEIAMPTGNFVSGTTASLYGVTAGGDGTVTTS